MEMGVAAMAAWLGAEVGWMEAGVAAMAARMGAEAGWMG